jgi:type III pantothenate kinase
MRLDALHTYTSKLPKISREGEILPLGKNTETAIRSGVIRGIEHEINGYIQQFQKIYP